MFLVLYIMIIIFYILQIIIIFNVPVFQYAHHNKTIAIIRDAKEENNNGENLKRN